ncbi:MAG TPA: hypothetical protein VK335_15010 [Bryobacteraceae bacterium]|nr:hypothetical protein [Bryobacteraceae bacterium]
MMGESILWELTKLRRHMGGTAGVSLYVLCVAVLGIVAPLYFGFALVEVRVLLMYACLPLLFVPPAVAESVAGERELKPDTSAQRREWLNSKIGAGAVYGWLSVVVTLALALVSLRVSLGSYLDLPLLFASGLALVSLASSLFAACLAAAVATGARSAKAAKRTMRQGLLLLLIVLLYLSRQPWAWTRRLAIPENGPGFLEFTVVLSVVLVGFSAGLAKLAMHSVESTEIRLNL